MSSVSDVELLTAQELAFIERAGVPHQLRPEHGVVLSNGVVRLSPRGAQFYRRACERYGFEGRFPGLISIEALDDLCRDVSHLRVARSVQALQLAYTQGQLTPQERALAVALLHGTAEEIEETAVLQSRLPSTSQNVAAFPRMKKPPQEAASG